MATKPTSSAAPARSKNTPPKVRRGDAGPNRWDYAPAPESTKIVQLRDRYDHFIDGEWVKPSSKKYFTSISPATLKPLAEVAEGSAKDVDRAVVAARRAFEQDWSK